MPSQRSSGGFKRLRKALDDLSKLQAKTGWKDSAVYEDGTKVVDVAQYNEFGSKHTPPRPFVRVAVAESGQKWSKSLVQGVKAVINGNADVRDVLGSTADLAAGDIAKAIEAVTAPPLKASTIRKKKGRSKPLEDTNLMLQSVTGIVEDA